MLQSGGGSGPRHSLAVLDLESSEPRGCTVSRCDFIVKPMDFIVKPMDFILKPMNFILKLTSQAWVRARKRLTARLTRARKMVEEPIVRYYK